MVCSINDAMGRSLIEIFELTLHFESFLLNRDPLGFEFFKHPDLTHEGLSPYRSSSGPAGY